MSVLEPITITALTLYPVKGCSGINVQSAHAFEQGLGVKLSSGKWLHDRQWMIVNAQGRFTSQREVPAMAAIKTSIIDNGIKLSFEGQDDLIVDYSAMLSNDQSRDVSVWSFKGKGLDAGPAAMAWLSKALNRPAALVLFDNSAPRACKPLGSVAASTFFADGFPYLVANEESVNDLESRLREHYQDAYLTLPTNRFRPNITLKGIAPYEEDLLETLEFPNASIEMVLKCVRCSVPAVDQQSGVIQAAAPTPLLDQFRFDSSLGGAVFAVNAILKHAKLGKASELKLGDKSSVNYAF